VTRGTGHQVGADVIAKRYARAGVMVYGHDEDGLDLYGDLVKCKKCKAVLFGTLFRFHDHWHDDHEDDVDWESFLGSFL
jgi:hypothetical protein